MNPASSDFLFRPENQPSSSRPSPHRGRDVDEIRSLLLASHNRAGVIAGVERIDFGCVLSKSRLDRGDGNEQINSRSHHRCVPRFLLHASEQYFTSAQTFAHFLRHANGRLQTGHIFVGRFGLPWLTSTAPRALLPASSP